MGIANRFWGDFEHGVQFWVFWILYFFDFSFQFTYLQVCMVHFIIRMLKNDLPIDFVSQWFQHNRMNVVDKEIKNGEIVRLHIPIITNEQVTMITWLETKIPTKFKMRKGECWWLDVSKPHQVLNESEIDRVHLVIDVYVNNFITETLALQ